MVKKLILRIVKIAESCREAIRQRYCSHEFQLKNLKGTGIPEPEKPKNNDFHEWRKYLDELYHGDSFTKRVQWPCCKCGKIFYAHCGLDISPKYGPIVIVPRKQL